MCGIFGYVGRRRACPILLEGLKRLEYRGYDSAGMAVLNQGKIKLVKEAGKINVLEQELKGTEMSGNMGIAHTRWATHGPASKENAHPHTDCKNKIVIVHNGIIENHLALKKYLSERGHKFSSKTDSELIAHLIEEIKNKSLLDRVLMAVQSLEGTYGLLIMVVGEEKKIIAVRNGSPLVIGMGENENFVASDSVAFLEHTKKINYLEDGQIAMINSDSYQIMDFKKRDISPKVSQITESLEEIEKGGYEHFMLKEIFEQPRSLKDTMAGRVKLNETAVGRAKQGRVYLGGLREIWGTFLDKQNILLTACGTSWHACLVGEMLFELMAGRSAEVNYASELSSVFAPDSLAIVISQSGETKDTELAVQKLQDLGILTLGICNVVGSTIARKCGSGVYIHAGPEIGVASTKAFTAQIIALVMMSFSLGKASGFISHNFRDEWPERFIRNILDLPAQVQAILDEANEIKKIAELFYQKNNFLFLGRGINLPTALEGALKLKEISYIHAEGYPAAEMKHGPIALIDEEMPVVVIIPSNDNDYCKIMNNIHEVKTRGGIVIALASRGDEEIDKIVDHVIYVPKTSYFLTPILNVIPLQLFAYYSAVMRGHDPDQPKNLAKSVTVE
jgi:glucosamine--fructose-6-phosphate aminotransferase (isomerizing)